jgi:hypothetical protein
MESDTGRQETSLLIAHAQTEECCHSNLGLSARPTGTRGAERYCGEAWRKKARRKEKKGDDLPLCKL